MRLIGKVRRVWAELRAPAVKPLDCKKIMQQLDALKFGLRCMMAMGGYKYKPFGMGDVELRQRGDQTVTMCANLELMVRCAEDVIVRHGLTDEYRSQLRDLEVEINKVVSDPGLIQMILDKKAKAVNDGERVDVRGAGPEGLRPVDQTGLHPDLKEGSADN